MQYKRTDITGASYFFTANLTQRHKRLLIDHVDALRQAVKTVKHGYTNKASEWPHSSIHRYIKSGMIDKNWGVDTINIQDENYGEIK